MSSLCFGSKFWFWRNWVASLIVVMLHYVICRLQLILILVAVGTLLTNTRWQYSILHRPWCVLSCVMAMRYEIYLILHVKNLWHTWGLNHLQQFVLIMISDYSIIPIPVTSDQRRREKFEEFFSSYFSLISYSRQILLIMQYVTRYSRKSLRVLGSVGEPINPSAWRSLALLYFVLCRSQRV